MNQQEAEQSLEAGVYRLADSRNPPDALALTSIAISLKRIADAMTDGRFGGLDFEIAAERAGNAFSIGMRGR